MNVVDATRNAVRILGLGILITATLIDPTPFKVLTRADIQIVFAALIVFVILFVDHIFGFMIGLSVLVIYSRVFVNTYGVRPFGNKVTEGQVSAYVTEQHLDNAQNNIVDAAHVDEPYKGVNGMRGEAVYSAQGLDRDLPGMELSVGQVF